ncbi:MAG: hypothetical protein R3F17_15605 [Planctomycetota bacterium]
MPFLFPFGPAEDGPTLLLFDARGLLSVIHRGPASAEDVLWDLENLLREPPKGALRGAWGGRWFHGMQRDLGGLERSWRALGANDWADRLAR